MLDNEERTNDATIERTASDTEKSKVGQPDCLTVLTQDHDCLVYSLVLGEETGFRRWASGLVTKLTAFKGNDIRIDSNRASGVLRPNLVPLSYMRLNST